MPCSSGPSSVAIHCGQAHLAVVNVRARPQASRPQSHVLGFYPAYALGAMFPHKQGKPLGARFMTRATDLRVDEQLCHLDEFAP
jgi:hypothetical protein